MDYQLRTNKGEAIAIIKSRDLLSQLMNLGGDFVIKTFQDGKCNCFVFDIEMMLITTLSIDLYIDKNYYLKPLI
jgi:hypothetical protein